jgi:hypothetical protein
VGRVPEVVALDRLRAAIDVTVLRAAVDAVDGPLAEALEAVAAGLTGADPDGPARPGDRRPLRYGRLRTG